MDGETQKSLGDVAGYVVSVRDAMIRGDVPPSPEGISGVYHSAAYDHAGDHIEWEIFAQCGSYHVTVDIVMDDDGDATQWRVSWDDLEFAIEYRDTVDVYGYHSSGTYASGEPRDLESFVRPFAQVFAAIRANTPSMPVATAHITYAHMGNTYTYAEPEFLAII